MHTGNSIVEIMVFLILGDIYENMHIEENTD